MHFFRSIQAIGISRKRLIPFCFFGPGVKYTHHPTHFFAVREKKIENMDETDIDDLAKELEDEDADAAKKKEEEDLKLKKKKARLAERLAAEQRKEEKAAKRGKKKSQNDDDDDDGEMATFAKGSRNSKKKK